MRGGDGQRTFQPACAKGFVWLTSCSFLQKVLDDVAGHVLHTFDATLNLSHSLLWTRHHFRPTARSSRPLGPLGDELVAHQELGEAQQVQQLVPSNTR